MKLTSIIDGLKDGSISVDNKGHRVNPVLRQLEWRYNEIIEDIDKKKNNHKDTTLGLDYYKSKLDVSVGMNSICMIESYCFDCGAWMVPVLVDEKNIVHITKSEWWNFRDTNQDQDTIAKHQIPMCSAIPLREKGYSDAMIEIPTGEVLFTNHFGSVDKFYDPENFEGEINNATGRQELMKLLATENIGYGQMGNMSVTVFVKKDGSEVIISGAYGYDNEKDEEYDIKFKGFTKCGNISLSVWRWQCGDIKTLTDGGFELPPNLKHNKSVDHDYHDYILTKLKPGKWEIKHYFDFMKDEEGRNPIYSHLKLIK